MSKYYQQHSHRTEKTKAKDFGLRTLLTAVIMKMTVFVLGSTHGVTQAYQMHKRY